MVEFHYKFEDLPNELMIEICKYLDAREVFQSLFNLNNRFKKLLQSFVHLQLTVSLFDCQEKRDYEYYFLHIGTLIIERGFNLNLKYFQNLRRLILHNPKEKIFEQLKNSSLPRIEYLSITHKFLTTTIQALIIRLYENIFSKHFLHLKSCNLSDMNVEIPIQNHYQPSSLYILKIGRIDASIYKLILSLCPNLYFFEFKNFPSATLLSNIIIHTNLKQLIIKDENELSPWHDQFLYDYLLCVPNLQKFTIHRTNLFEKLTNYFNYNWLSTTINRSLHLLEQFNFILHIYGDQRFTKCYKQKFFCSLKESFLSSHKGRYQSRIKFLQE